MKKITKDQKEQITKNVTAVSKMDYSKLTLYVQELFIAKPLMDDVVFKYTLRACDLCAANFRDVTNLSPLVVISELPSLD